MLLFIFLFFGKTNRILIDFGTSIYKVSDSFNTLTSIFAGIYFSLYTLLLTIPSFSVVKKLNKPNYHYLLLAISIGLLTSVLYSVMQVLLGIWQDMPVLFGINFVIIIAFLLSLLQNVLFFGIVLGSDLQENYAEGHSNELERDIQYIKSWTKKQDMINKSTSHE